MIVSFVSSSSTDDVVVSDDANGGTRAGALDRR
jgi:hypothetical protein